MVPAFGKYSDLLTTFIAGFVVVAAVVAHMLGQPHTEFVDAAAWIALGAMFGKVSAANGYAKMALQAHARLDMLGAPPANDGAGATPQTPVG